MWGWNFFSRLWHSIQFLCDVIPLSIFTVFVSLISESLIVNLQRTVTYRKITSCLAPKFAAFSSLYATEWLIEDQKGRNKSDDQLQFEISALYCRALQLFLPVPGNSTIQTLKRIAWSRLMFLFTEVRQEIEYHRRIARPRVQVHGHAFYKVRLVLFGRAIRRTVVVGSRRTGHQTGTGHDKSVHTTGVSSRRSYCVNTINSRSGKNQPKGNGTAGRWCGPEAICPDFSS